MSHLLDAPIQNRPLYKYIVTTESFVLLLLLWLILIDEIPL